MKLILPFFIFSIFLFINKAAFAEWSLYGETDAGYHFINLDDTSSDDKYVYYWILTDYKKIQNNNISNISLAGLCTFENSDLFYSYRRGLDKGRFGTFCWIE